MQYLSCIESTLDGAEHPYWAASETYFDSYGTEIAFVIKPPNRTNNKKKVNNYIYKVSSIKVQLSTRNSQCCSYCAIQQFINDTSYKNQPGRSTDKYPVLWESKMFETQDYVEFKNINLVLNDKDYYIWYLYKDSGDKRVHHNPLVGVEKSLKQNSKFLDNLKLTHPINYYKDSDQYSDRSTEFVTFYQIEFVLNFSS